MKRRFSDIICRNNRSVVVHHTHLIHNLCNLLKQNDIVFFDDCLYSQYLFFKNNLDQLLNKHITVVLGFSSALYRPVDVYPTYSVLSKTLHDNINAKYSRYTDIDYNDPIFSGFMSISEICELLQYDFVYLALHGCCHLNYKNITNRIQQAQTFANDLTDGILNMNNLLKQTTNIFVHPYAYEPFLAARILKTYKFIYVFATNDSKRIEVEELQK